MNEEWRDVPGFEGYYQASDIGRIRSLDRPVRCRGGKTRISRGRIIKTNPGDAGYLQARLSKENIGKTVRVHEAVTLAFLGPRPLGQVVCHFDGDKTNNNLTNLRYDSTSENFMDEVRSGRNFYKKKTHCVNGHEFTPENTKFRPGVHEVPSRQCKTCTWENNHYHAAVRRDSKLNKRERLALSQELVVA